jgi:activator of HSP90 ATPase
MMKSGLHRFTAVFPVFLLAIFLVGPSGQASERVEPKPSPDPPAAAAPADLIHVELELQASPTQIYESLLDSKIFGAFTGLPTEIDRQTGGAFSCFGGRIVGRNLELVANKRLVQAWRSTSWPEGVYSIARFELTARGTGSRLVFDHTGFPPDQRDHLSAGWEDHYWRFLRGVK